MGNKGNKGSKGDGRGGRRESGAGNGAEETVARVLGAVRYAADGRAAEDAVEAGASALSELVGDHRLGVDDTLAEQL
ncbi:hypothetical protein ABT381_35180, partial [Streptomyces sp. NPDC000151]